MSILQQIEQLNAAQQQAVTCKLGNLLVLAGAGSGKTRVLVHRIAWLMTEQTAHPSSILAVTFTNKAAGEMRQRLTSMLDMNIRGLWVGTFHGLAHKLLRMHWKECQLPEHFQVMDSDDQLRLVKRIFKQLGVNEDRWEPKKAQGFINRKKDEGVRAEKLGKYESSYEQVMGEIYQCYEVLCQESGLVDFAELLLRSYELLTKNPVVLEHYQARFKHFLVDEFQDTNTIQYQWLKLLAKSATSVTVVGDDDQSIYGWRGAQIENIQRFEKEFVNTEVVRLEQNYRSTSTILSAANALINHNGGRMGKTLWTQGEAGDPIVIYSALNEDDEAHFIIRQVQKHIERGGCLSDIGILYRSNAQSRVIEEGFVRSGIAYSIYGGLRFFERAEIKDALAYLKLSVNLNDNAAFERVVNIPPRGIGGRSLEKLRIHAEEQGQPLWEAAKYAVENKLVSPKARMGLDTFIAIIEALSERATKSSVTEMVEQAISQSGLLLYFKEQRGEKAQSKAENLQELVNATADFIVEPVESEYEPLMPPLTEFLAYTSLEAGERQAESEQASVQLMTLHSAKGLEFPVVFICGVEEGLFPHHFSTDSAQALEEERRLCYVGITRAMAQLYITYAQRRRLFGREESRRVSRFVKEIPDDLVEEQGRRFSMNPGSQFRQSVVSEPSFFAGEELHESGFNLGQRVMHVKFGAGTVVDHEGQGERARVSVRFDEVGTKWLVLSYAKLEPA